LTKVEELGKRVGSLEPKPRNEADFSAQQLAQEMKENLNYLTTSQGSGCLTNQYGKDYSLDILTLIQKAEASNCTKADDFIRQLSEDEQGALAHLIVKIEKATQAKNPLRSKFVQAFNQEGEKN
jgi:hypothetical protein